MKNLLAALVALMVMVSLAIPSGGYASDKFANKGQIELGGTLGFSSTTRVTAGTTGNSVTNVDLSPFVGYFIIDQLELGLHLQLTSASSPKASSTDYTVLLSPAWNFKIENSAVTPVIAGLIGFGSTNSSGTTASGLSIGGRGAVKVLVVSNGILHVGVQYLMNSRNPSGYSGSRNGTNVVNFEAGFTIFFN